MAKHKNTADPSVSNGHVPRPRMKNKEYRRELRVLHGELVALQEWVKATGAKVCIVFEGRDTAGKGGTIKAITERVSPRVFRVIALPAPSPRERSQMYLQRYVPHLPGAGDVVIFDRSWYNRAGVEPVMGFCTPAQTAAFLQQAPRFEKLLVDDGVLLFKYWLTVDQAQQEARFAERLEDPMKRWKLSPIDLKAREKYAAYTKAREAMLEATHTKHAPWTLVDFNDQRRGRLTLIRHLLDHLPDTAVPEEKIEFAPLPGRPLKESFRGKCKPIPSAG
jgi:polyphosphate kinase 2